MKKQDNSWFLAPIQGYDSALTVRWAPLVNQWALERDMHDSDQSTIDRLKEVMHRYSNRKIPYGLDIRRRAKIEARRRDLAERLQSLQKKRRIIFYIEALTLASREGTLRTLKETDLWNHGDTHYSGDKEDHGNRVAARMDRDEENEKQRQQRSFEKDLRYHGLDAWLDTKRRSQERINNAGFPKSKLVIARRTPLIVPGR